ncbi:MAG: hypothetical protein HY270_22700 [Deltaproteobacteria bacterium]|nr:hypothetical protein [Deltaproteobacteria bacterium]
MNEADRVETTAFQWNAGAWFGSQLGCTIWLLIYGMLSVAKDLWTAVLSIGGFFVLNAWGVHLWRLRDRLAAYPAMQRFLLMSTPVVALLTFVANRRGVSQPPNPGDSVSTYLPYWIVLVCPALMLGMFVLERATRAVAK